MDLLFSLSHLQEKDKDVIADSVNAILKGDKNKNDIGGDDSTVGESFYDDNDDVSLDELLKDVEEDEDDCEDEEEVQEAKEAVKKTLPKEIAEPPIEMFSVIEKEIKPGLHELRQVRIELKNTNIDRLA